MSQVLVYHYRHNASSPIIADGLAVMSTSELDEILQNHPELQRSTKPITRGVWNVDVYQRDLLTETQKTEWASKPNYDSNVAGVPVPFKVLLGRLVGSKNFDELVILSENKK